MIRVWRAFVRKWGADNIQRLAAATSFYSALSLAPLLVLAVALISNIFGSTSEAQARLLDPIGRAAGPTVERYVQELVSASSHPSTSAVATLISLVVTFFSASNLFLQVNDSIHAIWSVTYDRHWIRAFLISRLFAFLSVVFFGLLMVVWLGLESWLEAVGPELMNPRSTRWLVFFGAFIFVTCAFGFVYRAIPAQATKWRDVWGGALVASSGVMLSKLVVEPYLRFIKISVAYGAAGVLMIILMWIYYVSIMFYTGSLVVYIQTHRDRIRDDGSFEPAV